MIRSLLVASIVLFGAASAHAQAPVSALSVVVTQGEATLKRAPNRAWLTIATETRDPQAPEARRLSAEGMTALQAAVKGVGLTDDAIRTTGYSLVPDMEWKNGRGIIRGYLVRNQIEVRIDDLDKVSAVIDAVNASKSTTVSVTGPRFGLKDAASLQAEALRMAVASAVDRARAMASGAGRAIGPIVRIEESNLAQPMPPQPVMMRMAAESATSTPIEPGEIEVRAVVTVTAELR